MKIDTAVAVAGFFRTCIMAMSVLNFVWTVRYWELGLWFSGGIFLAAGLYILSLAFRLWHLPIPGREESTQ